MAKIQQKSSRDLKSIDHLKLRGRAALELKNLETHSFRQYVAATDPQYNWYWHCESVAANLEKIASDELKRVMILMPPRHGKSELVSRKFAGYYLRKHPDREVGLCSYSADLAFGLSRDARDNFLRSEGAMRSDIAATREWRTPKGGGMWAAGVGGPITGKGFHLGIIDDPLKNAEEAYSRNIREKQKDWYRSTFYTRQEPGAAQVIIMTRWHEEDLVGWLLQEELQNPQRWHIILFDALRQFPSLKIPATCTLESDPRAEAAALCPERYGEKLLAGIKTSVGTVFWNSEYQQRPTSVEGDIWKRSWFKTFDPQQLLNEKDELKRIQVVDIGADWDLAYTKDERNSASAYVRAGKHVYRSGNITVTDIYVFEVEFRWVEFPDMIKWMIETPGPHYIEQKASGKSAVQTLKKSDIAAKEVAVEGGVDKIGRAKLASPAAESGHVYIAKNAFEKLMDDPRQGILNFPNGGYDDLNDAFVQSINRLYKKSTFRFGAIGMSDHNEAARWQPREMENMK